MSLSLSLSLFFSPILFLSPSLSHMFDYMRVPVECKYIYIYIHTYIYIYMYIYLMRFAQSAGPVSKAAVQFKSSQ